MPPGITPCRTCKAAKKAATAIAQAAFLPIDSEGSSHEVSDKTVRNIRVGFVIVFIAIIAFILA